MPLVRLTTGTQGRNQPRAWSMVVRKPFEGTPTMSTSAERTACSRSAVASSLLGKASASGGRWSWCGRG